MTPPTLIANNTRLHHNPQSKFLGVTLDSLLTFGPHIQSIPTKAAARRRILASCTSKEWGWRKVQLMKVYKALQLSLLTYVAPAWQPWATPSIIEQLERCQNKARSVVTGQLKFTTVETLRREAGICSIATAARRATVLVYEKAHRLPPDHPGQQILTESGRSRSTHPPYSNGPAALPLQNKIGLLSDCLHAARRRSTHPSTSWSHPAHQGLQQSTWHGS